MIFIESILVIQSGKLLWIFICVVDKEAIVRLSQIHKKWIKPKEISFLHHLSIF